MLADQRPASDGPPFRHVISLGCRCTSANIFKSHNKRRYAGPFDWAFCCPAIVASCLRDDFQAFLDRKQYFLAATKHDTVGLPPGSRPQERRLIGHKTFSPMMRGVGRGVIFNHRDPLHVDEDLQYLQRAVARFRHVLQSEERKLFVILNINEQLWTDYGISALFDELYSRTSNFLLLAVDCVKHAGERAFSQPAEILSHQIEGNAELLTYRLHCAGDNTGSYFRDNRDGVRVKELLIDPYRFALANDPLAEGDSAPADSAAAAALASAAPSDSDADEGDGNEGEVALIDEEAANVDAGRQAAEDAVVHDGEEAKAQPRRARRWGGKH